MILYKNVDLCDLQAIAENGILSMDDCKNAKIYMMNI